MPLDFQRSIWWTSCGRTENRRHRPSRLLLPVSPGQPIHHHPSARVVSSHGTDPFCRVCFASDLIRCYTVRYLHQGKLHHAPSGCSRAHHSVLFTDKAPYIAVKQSCSHDLCPTKCLDLKSLSKLRADHASGLETIPMNKSTVKPCKTIRPQTSLNCNLSSSAFGMLHPKGKEWAKMRTCRTMPSCCTWNQGTCPNIFVQLGHIQQRYSWPDSALYPPAVLGF